MSTISLTIKSLREQAELSQNQLAHQAEVSVGFISKLEAGQYKTISLDKCHQLAKGLRMTLRDLLAELGLLEETTAPNAALALQNALRGSGFTQSEAKKVIQYGEFLKNTRDAAE